MKKHNDGSPDKNDGPPHNQDRENQGADNEEPENNGTSAKPPVTSRFAPMPFPYLGELLKSLNGQAEGITITQILDEAGPVLYREFKQEFARMLTAYSTRVGDEPSCELYESLIRTRFSEQPAAVLKDQTRLKRTLARITTQVLLEKGLLDP